jgi:hypothetical protein
MADPRVATCLFCDDIRWEVGNKSSIMGIYTSEMIFATSPPATISRFAVVVFVVTDKGDELDTFTITVTAPPDNAEIMRAEFAKPALPSDLFEGATKIQGRAYIMVNSVHIAGEGFIEAIVDTGREKIRAGRLRVRFNPAGRAS